MDTSFHYDFNRLIDIRWLPLPFFSSPADVLLTPAQSSPILAFPIVASILAICLLAVQTNISGDTVLAAHLVTFIATCFCTQVPASLAFGILAKSLLFFLIVREVPNIFGSFRLQWLLRGVVEILILVSFAVVLWAVATEEGHGFVKEVNLERIRRGEQPI